MVTPLAAVRDRLEAAGIPDAAFEAAQLYMLATGRDARLSGGAPLTAFEQKKLDALCEKRCARFPLQYLCGEWDFLDLTLKVGPGVLIPRADTETVAEAAIEAAREAGPGAAVADLCSGTGAIALGVATHVPGARVTAVELSPDALAYLRANNAACGCPLCVVQADVLRWQEECAPGSFDVIVSNPPYIAPEEMAGCSRSFSMSRAWRWRPRTGAWPSTSISRLLISARSNRAAVSFWRSAGVRRTLCVLCAFLRDMRMCLSAVI